MFMQSGLALAHLVGTPARGLDGLDIQVMTPQIWSIAPEITRRDFRALPRNAAAAFPPSLTRSLSADRSQPG
jgi:hypothetical protein